MLVRFKSMSIISLEEKVIVLHREKGACMLSGPNKKRIHMAHLPLFLLNRFIIVDGFRRMYSELILIPNPQLVVDVSCATKKLVYPVHPTLVDQLK